jgi:fructose-1,6-bisphosphatase
VTIVIINMVLLDPLDGSTVIDVNVSGNYFFSLYKNNPLGTPVTMDDFLQPERVKQDM